jgi:hypothetical protein
MRGVAMEKGCSLTAKVFQKGGYERKVDKFEDTPPLAAKGVKVNSPLHVSINVHRDPVQGR